MGRCSTCSKDWPAGYHACPDDGTRLVVTARDQATRALAAAPTPAMDDRNELAAGAMVGEFVLGGKLGEGGMGAVYSATHPLIGKKAAIKVISATLCTDSSAVERFVQEARSVNQIGHPNIVDVFAFGVLPDGRSYLAMEWLQGETLAERMARGELGLPEAVEILDQVCDALEAAHEKGIVHRDLKPDNVFLMAVRGNRQLVKLLDFGIAKLAGEGDLRVQKTRTGMMMGTPAYLSPEQARGKHVDHRTDVYALGAMMFEMVTGHLPFEADNAMDVVMKHLTEPAPTPSASWPEIPPALDRLILSMLEKDPAMRPALAEIRRALDQLRGELLSSLASGGGTRTSPSTFAPRLMTPATGVPIRRTPAPPTVEAVVPAPAVEPAVRGGGKRIALVLGGLCLAGGIVAVVLVGGRRSAPDRADVAAVVNAPRPADPAPKPPAPTPRPPDPAPTPAATPVPIATPPKPATVVVATNVANARITLDGKVVAASASGATVSLPDEKDHELAITAPGTRPFTKTVSAAAGTTITVEAKLEKIRTPHVTTARKPPKHDGQTGGQVGGDYTVDPFGPDKK